VLTDKSQTPESSLQAVSQISPVTPRETQRIAVSALTGDGVQLSSLTLWADDQVIATLTEPPYRTLWTLQPGPHTFVACGVDQNGRELASPPVTITVLP
jgi:hypothetical protein